MLSVPALFERELAIEFGGFVVSPGSVGDRALVVEWSSGWTGKHQTVIHRGDLVLAV